MILLSIVLCAGLSWSREIPAVDDGGPQDSKLITFLIKQIQANQTRLDAARGKTPKPPQYQGLPETVNASLPEDEDFVRYQRVEGEELEGEITVPGAADPEPEDFFDDDESALLPPGATIRRDRSLGYEIWHYPPGTRLVHRIYLKSDHRLVEMRMGKKLDDDAGGDGPWAFGIYRPENGGNVLKLYKEENGRRESVDLPLPGKPGALRWTRLKISDCRHCHVDMGPGWYQYSDEDHAGPCGFVPKNHSLLTDWAPRYEKRHGRYPFIGP